MASDNSTKRLVTKLKDLSQYGDMDLALPISKLSECERTNLYQLLSTINPAKSEKTKKAPNPFDKTARVTVVLETIYKALEKYDRLEENVSKCTITINSWDYTNMDDATLKTHHSDLESGCDLVTVTSLIFRYERGRLYNAVKSKYGGNWKEYCSKTLGTCETTANRHISFYSFAASYPRILVTGLSFSTVMVYMQSLLKVINDPSRDLRERLQEPLRSMTVHCDVQVEPFEASDESPEVFAEHKYEPGWELFDPVIESRNNCAELCESVDTTSIC